MIRTAVCVGGGFSFLMRCVGEDGISAVVDGGPLYDAFAAALEARRIPTFRAADRALRVFARWCEARGAKG